MPQETPAGSREGKRTHIYGEDRRTDGNSRIPQWRHPFPQMGASRKDSLLSSGHTFQMVENIHASFTIPTTRTAAPLPTVFPPSPWPTPHPDLPGLFSCQISGGYSEKYIWPGFMQRFRPADLPPFSEKDHGSSWLKKIPCLKGGLEGKARGWMDYITSTRVTQAMSHADTCSARVPQGPSGSWTQKYTQAHWTMNS